MRARLAWGLLGAVFSTAASSGAASPARACIDAHAEGQIDRGAGRLLRASERFRACAADPCPALIRAECQELGAKVEKETPSLLIGAEDARGQVISGATAAIDSGQRLPVLNGAPLLLDPGVHQIDVTLEDGRSQTLHLSLSYGEKGRPAVARFEPLARRRTEGRGNELAYVIGGAGLLGLGAWGAFAWDGRRRQADLESCAPRCPDRSEVGAMRRSYLIADVLLGLSAAALGTSAYLLVTNSSGEEGVRERAVVVGTRGSF